MTDRTNAELLAEAVKLMPGGVNSPVRAFGPVGGQPPFITRAKGARLWDAEGNEYIDYVGSWGPMILGHAHPAVVAAVQAAAEKGTSFGAPTEGEIELARAIIERIPSVQMVRLVNSGTEATMTALRLARGYTERPKIAKFTGCYHGHADAFLVKAGSGAATLGTPTSPGVPPGVVADTLTAPLNDLGSVERLFEAEGDTIAAVIVEPVVGNSGVIPLQPGFLEGLRKVTRKNGALLILDEVMTGFRVAPGGAQELYGVEPDLTTLGKVIGGGMPIGAVGGRRGIMEMLAPVGPVYQAGTLSGNPVAVAAGTATLRGLTAKVYERLESLAARLEAGVRANLEDLGLPWQYQRVGSMACLYFTDRPVRDFEGADGSNRDRFAAYHGAMLEAGIYLPPSQFEAFFLGAAHTEEDIDRTVAANREALEAAG